MRVTRNALMTFSFLQIASYFLLIKLISLLLSTSFDSVVIDLSGNHPLLKTLNVLALIIGLSIIYFTPGILCIAKGKESNLHELITKSVLLSIVLYTAIFSVLKLVLAIDLSRTWLLLTCLAITIAWTILDKRQFEIRLTKMDIRRLLIGGLTILSLIILFQGKIFLENFSGDGTESFEFSRSLKTRVLPYWDLENGNWGFYPRFMFFAYPNILSILHLGETEASVRLPFFVFLFCIYLLMDALIRHGPDHSKAQISDSVLVSLAIVTFVICNIFYSTWHPYFADIAEPTHVDTMVTFYFLSAILFLLTEQKKWFLLCCLLASLSVANGLILTSFLFLAFFLLGRNRKPILYLGLSFMVVYVAYLGFVAIYDTFYPLGFQRWSMEGMLRYFSWNDLLSPKRYYLHAKYLLLMTGVMPVLLFPLSLLTGTKDRLALKIYLAAGLYALGVFSFRNTNPHYFTSVALVFFVPFLRAVGSMQENRAVYVRLTYGVVAGIIIVLIFPFRYTLNQDARNMGNQTCIEAADYRAQVRLAEGIYKIFPFKKYGVGHHTLVHYSAKENCSVEEVNYIWTTKRDTFENRDEFVGKGGDLLMRKGVKKPRFPRKRYDSNYRYIVKEVYDSNRRGR